MNTTKTPTATPDTQPKGNEAEIPRLEERAKAAQIGETALGVTYDNNGRVTAVSRGSVEPPVAPRLDQTTGVLVTPAEQQPDER